MTASLQALLAGAIDYAGLFPPASLELAAALANYLAYQRAPDAWALGRFVVPAGRLTELAGLLQREESAASVRLTVLLNSGDAAEVAAVQRFNQPAPAPGTKVESVEVKGSSEGAIRAVLTEIPPVWRRYVEVPLGPESEAALGAVQSGGAFAKVRTGGTTEAAIPSPQDLLRFLKRAMWRKLPFKATAGLHHPLRGVYRLTYEENAPRATMHGYLNLLLAAAILWHGGSLTEALAALLEADPQAVRFHPAAVSWRSLQFDLAALAAVRGDFFHSFGSCSFREPLDELAAGGWT